MIKYHIDNWMSRQVKDMSVFQDLTIEEHERLYNEIKNATLQGLDGKLKEIFLSDIKVDNKTNSLLLWVLGLTDEKPTGYQDIKSEGSMMDIDSDIGKSYRGQVFDYIKDKYGHENVSSICTFGTMAAKGAIRNAARALGYSIELQNKVAKFIPDLPGVTIQESIDTNIDLKNLIDKDKEVKHIINIALKLEGLPNSCGSHASGKIISPFPISDLIPLMVGTKKDGSDIMTQFEYYDSETLGQIKFDLLGLKTLDVIHLSLELIKKYKNITINMLDIDVNDSNIYKLLSNGHTTLVFQFESSMFKDAAIKVIPTCLDDLSAITSAKFSRRTLKWVICWNLLKL